jgi:hypothetical protein
LPGNDFDDFVRAEKCQARPDNPVQRNPRAWRCKGKCVSERHCERSDPTSFFAATKTGLLRFARNDGVCIGMPTSASPGTARNTALSIIFLTALQNLDLNNSKFRSNIFSRVHSME